MLIGKWLIVIILLLKDIMKQWYLLTNLNYCCFNFCRIISFIIIAITKTIAVTIPYNKILVYHGADCIAYKSGWVLKSHNTYIPCPIKTPINAPMIVFKIRLNIFMSVTSYSDFSRFSLIDIIPDKTVICNCHNKQDRIMLAFLIESANLKRFLNYETIPSYQKAYYLCVVCFINTYLEMGLLFFLSAIKYITLYRKICLSSNALTEGRESGSVGLHDRPRYVSGLP